MKKIINAPGDIVPEMIAGLAASYPQYLKQIPDTTAVVRNDAAFIRRSASSLVAVPVMNRCMPAMSVKACLMLRWRAKSSHPRPQIKFTLLLKKLTKVRAF